METRQMRADISAAKELLYSYVVDVKLDGLPRCSQRRKSDDRAKLEVDDIFTLMDFMDVHLALDTFPSFVAKKLEKIPPFNADALDLCLAAVKRIAALEQKVGTVFRHCLNPAVSQESDKRFAALEDKIDEVMKRGVAPSGTVNKGSSQSEGTTMGGVSAFSGLGVSDIITTGGDSTESEWPSLIITDNTRAVVEDCPRPAWAQKAAALAGAQVSSVRRVSVKSTKRTIRGSRRVYSGAMSVSAVPRRVVAFLGRMNRDTKEEDLLDKMSEAGLQDPGCIRLKAKDGREFSTAAFRVSCSVTSKDIFYDGSMWPEGCELRDWVFYSKSDSLS
jgi:hypothetical protein